MDKQYYVYMITNYENTTLYTGVTNDFKRRIYEHKNKLVDGFSSKYNLEKLVYYEVFDDIEQAIIREKKIKGGSRKKKEGIVSVFNPGWGDLYDSI
jgi:putative endonuclease